MESGMLAFALLLMIVALATNVAIFGSRIVESLNVIAAILAEGQEYTEIEPPAEPSADTPPAESRVVDVREDWELAIEEEEALRRVAEDRS